MGETVENTWMAQLSLPGMEVVLPKEIAGVEMAVVRGYFVQLQALDAQKEEITVAQKELRESMEDDGLPVKSILAALKIAKAKHKVHGDASPEMFCALLAMAMTMTSNPE